MERFKRRYLDDALLKASTASDKQREQLITEQRATRKPLGKLLVEKELISEDTLVAVMEEYLNIPRVNLFNDQIHHDAVDSIPAEMARRYRVIPVEHRGEQLVLAMVDPLDLAALDNVAMVTGKEVNPVIAGESAISYALDHYYSGDDSLDKRDPDSKAAAGETGAKTDPESAVNRAPVVKMVESLINRAIEEKASDIHLEPTDEGLRIRMRLDGFLHDLSVSNRLNQAHIISRIKVLANLDIAEKRLAQDGNIHHRRGAEEVNLRVSTMPTIHGEKVVIRLLEKEKIVLPLDKLGFLTSNYSAFQQLLLNRSGMVLVTGPTGCGKTTTLYSALNYLNHPRDNIITVEDPVEYKLNGINQVSVNRRINRTFANTLRTILRQDPDIIMIGEIRDLETVNIAIQAALTGHLVLSTLHTNNAAGAVTRLTDMGIEPFMVTASTVGVIAQRLIRKICPYCREEYRLRDEEKIFYRKYFKKDPPLKLHRGARCKRCNQTGYRGRTSIQELMVLNRDLQGLILKKAPAAALHQKAVELGMSPLLNDGLKRLEAGVTTINEVVRATYSTIFDAGPALYAESTAFLTKLYKNID